MSPMHCSSYSRMPVPRSRAGLTRAGPQIRAWSTPQGAVDFFIRPPEAFSVASKVRAGPQSPTLTILHLIIPAQALLVAMFVRPLSVFDAACPMPAMDLPPSHPSDATSTVITPPTQREASVTASSSSPRRGSQKRSVAPGSPSSDDVTASKRRKGHKVSRACDLCKQRKAKCTGTLPCTKCTNKGLVCHYDASYSRGRPPTPPPSRDHPAVPGPRATQRGRGEKPETQPGRLDGMSLPRASDGRHIDSNGPASRASPELGMAEIEGQVFDPTSGVTFLHRAWKRLAKNGHTNVSLDQAHNDAAVEQHVMLAGDRPLPQTTEEDLYRLTLPPHHDLVHLLALYFDVCIATYRIVHRPSVEAWMAVVETNVQQGKPAWRELGKSKTAIVLACLSVATAHHEKSRGIYSGEDDALSLARSDHLFCVCSQLTETETGSPLLESAQARIIQTLYLLTTSRHNRAWYTFGNALQLISALGLHRKTTRQRQLAPSPVDYLQGQLRMRTFWTAYILDKYLGVIFGRPRHYHDEDIDQDLPDRLEDEEITNQGPLSAVGEQQGCHIDALIFHAK